MLTRINVQRALKQRPKAPGLQVVDGLMNISLPSYVMNRDTDGDTDDPQPQCGQ